MHKAIKQRNVKRSWAPMVTTDGAGVTLKRGIGTSTVSDIDPFLLFDHFGSSNPDDYIAGFPMHPHRGIETVTYMKAGKIKHQDSVGNSGVIESGGVQWMTAGSGIMHEEMPEMKEGRLEGFQLWVNLRSSEKMNPPAYQEFDDTEVPAVETAQGAQVRVIAGSFLGTDGAVKGISGSPMYLDVSVAGGGEFDVNVDPEASLFVYLYDGSILFEEGDDGNAEFLHGPLLISFESDGDSIKLEGGNDGASFLVVAGAPIGEPIARYGPFVMNTEEEIQNTLEELRNGTFIKIDGGK